MDIFSKLPEIESKYNLKLHESENFKQSIYNGKMTDSGECIVDKIELIIKHYPNSKNICLSTYESDETSSDAFCHAVVVP